MDKDKLVFIIYLFFLLKTQLSSHKRTFYITNNDKTVAILTTVV